MTVFAQKNKKGDPTGKWVVEVSIGGVRQPKEVFMDFQEAKARELSLRMSTVVTPKAVAPSYSVKDLRRDARVIWLRTKDERQSLQRFDACMDLLGLDTPVKNIAKEELDDLLIDLRAQGLGDTTVHRYLCTVSAALKWACEHPKTTGIKAKVMFPWKSLDKAKPRQVVLTEADDERLMDHIRTKGSPDIGVVMDLLLATGMRIGELTKLKPEDFNTTKNTIQIGNWEGATKNGEKRMAVIEADLMVKAKALATVGWPTYRRVNTALHRARKALGIAYVITPHTMRHTVATRLNSAGTPVFTIMKMLGHKSMATTKGYVHADVKDIEEAVGALSRAPKKELVD